MLEKWSPGFEEPRAPIIDSSNQTDFLRYKMFNMGGEQTSDTDGWQRGHLAELQLKVGGCV